MGITISPISMELDNDFGLININTEFDEGLAYSLDKFLKSLFSYYQYRKVVLRVNSCGGSLLALTHITDCLDQWRQRGREIHTEATFTAASAGALLLSLGQVGTRTVNKHTVILYHHTRIGANAPVLTAGSADMLANAMRRVDAKLIAGLVTHIDHGFGQLSGLVEEGIARCELSARNAAVIEQELDFDKSPKSNKWLAAVLKMFRACRVRGTIIPFQRYLEQRFTPDTGMDLREAYCLLLIDCVTSVPSLVPCAYRAQTDLAVDACDAPNQAIGSP